MECCSELQLVPPSELALSLTGGLLTDCLESGLLESLLCSMFTLTVQSSECGVAGLVASAYIILYSCTLTFLATDCTLLHTCC